MISDEAKGMRILRMTDFFYSLDVTKQKSVRDLSKTGHSRKLLEQMGKTKTVSASPKDCHIYFGAR